MVNERTTSPQPGPQAVGHAVPLPGVYLVGRLELRADAEEADWHAAMGTSLPATGKARELVDLLRSSAAALRAHLGPVAAPPSELPAESLTFDLDDEVECSCGWRGMVRAGSDECPSCKVAGNLLDAKAPAACGSCHRSLRSCDGPFCPGRIREVLGARVRNTTGLEVALDRDAGGRIVRDAWIAWARQQPDPKLAWLVPYEAMSEPDKEADRQIYESVIRHHIEREGSALVGKPATPGGERVLRFPGKNPLTTSTPEPQS